MAFKYIDHYRYEHVLHRHIRILLISSRGIFLIRYCETTFRATDYYHAVAGLLIIGINYHAVAGLLIIGIIGNDLQ